MNRNTSNKIINILAALLIPAVLLLGAILLGVNDTKIPPELTMRTGEFDNGLFNGVTEDIAAVKNFTFSRDYRSMMLSHMDPFFLLATVLPEKGAVALLWFAYFLRFGLASLTMNCLLRKQMEFGAPFSCLLGIIYSLSSPVVLLASYTNSMNSIILIPCVLYFLIDFYRQGYHIKDGLRLSLVMGLTLLVSGDLALLYIVPFLLCAFIFIAACTASKFSKSLVSLICVIPYLVISVLIGGITIVNTFVSYDFAIEASNLKTFDFRLTFFDFLTRFFAGKPFAADKLSPAIYITIFVVLALLAFFFNSQIPLRIRITLLSVVILYHFSFASRAWYLISVLFKNSSMPSEISANMRFACLASLLIFAAAISLRNIHVLDKKTLFYCSAAIICFVIVSNNAAGNTSSSTFSLYFTALSAIIAYFLIANADKIDSKTITTVILFGLFIQLSFLLPISKYAPSLDEDSVVFDQVVEEKTCELPFEELEFFNKDNDSYILLHNYDAIEGNTIEQVNNIAFSSGVRPIFENLTECMSFFTGGRVPLINGEQAQEADGKVESYVNIRLTAEEVTLNLIAFSNHNGPVILEISHSEEEYKSNYSGPFVSVIDHNPINFQAKFFTPRGSISNPNDVYDFYVVDGDVLGAFASRIHKYNKSFVIEPANDGTTLYTVLTGRQFDNSIRVHVNGYEIETVNINGKLGFVLNPNVESVVEISSYNDDVIICLAISIFVLVCSIVIMLLLTFKGEKRADN